MFGLHSGVWEFVPFTTGKGTSVCRTEQLQLLHAPNNHPATELEALN